MSAAFRQGVAEFGYIEGKNYATELRIKPESLPQAAADLVFRGRSRIACRRAYGQD
jgi:hypothetical protein